MNTPPRQPRPWTKLIPVILIFLLGSCATGHLPYYHARAGDLNLLLPCPLSVTSGRFGTAWRALCSGNVHHARAIINDLSLDTPGRDVQILNLMADAAESNPEAWSKLETTLEKEKSGPVRLRLFMAQIQAINGHFIPAWEKLRTLPEQMQKRRKIAHWITVFRTQGIGEIGTKGLEAFQAEEKDALGRIVETFPVALQNEALYTAISTAYKALATPDDVDSNLLSGLEEPWASAIQTHLQSRHKTLEERIREAQEDLSRDQQNPAIQHRLFLLKKRWEVNNLPSFFSEAIVSTRLTRMQFSLIAAWLFPEIRLRTQETPPLFVDLLNREESRFILPLLAHHILPFASGPLRKFGPDREITADKVVASFLNVASQFNIKICGDSWETLTTCGAIPETWKKQNPVSGEEAIRLLQPIAWRLHAEN